MQLDRTVAITHPCSIMRRWRTGVSGVRRPPFFLVLYIVSFVLLDRTSPCTMPESLRAAVFFFFCGAPLVGAVVVFHPDARCHTVLNLFSFGASLFVYGLEVPHAYSSAVPILSSELLYLAD